MMSLKRVAPLFETASTANVIIVLFSERYGLLLSAADDGSVQILTDHRHLSAATVVSGQKIPVPMMHRYEICNYLSTLVIIWERVYGSVAAPRRAQAAGREPAASAGSKIAPA
ncbi:hypothetical protein [Rhizobium sp. L43]|uniref:hypothetical protein n=1 Tax=Rhizobium sp. L43 TaxID=2035452 RepID=UPI0015CF7B60|nr:hypothetical protein [Rhizobium sp. L43]